MCNFSLLSVVYVMGKYNFTRAFLGKANRGAARKGINALASAYMAGSGAYNFTRAATGRRNRGAARKAINAKFAGSGAYRRVGGARPRPLLGRGAYRSGGKGATFRGSPASHITVHHKEYIGDLITATANATGSSAAGPSAFSQQAYELNPGLDGTFPWLSGIAQNYSKYRFKQLVFHLKSLTSESTANTSGAATALGEVAVAAQYDVGGPNFGAYNNMSEMLNSEGCVSTKPSNSVTFGVECNPGDTPYKWYFVRTGDCPASTDPRLYDFANIMFASQQVPLAQSSGAVMIPLDLGQIWVEYTVEFECAVLGGYSSQNSAHYYGSGATASDMFAGETAVDNNQLSLTFDANTVTFPLSVTQGSYLVVYQNKFAAAAMTLGALTCTACSVTGTFSAGTASDALQGPQAGLTGQTHHLIGVIITIDAPGATLAALTFAANTAATTTWDLLITPYNNQMLTV